MIKLFISIMFFLVALNVEAASVPPLPYAHVGVCEGEDCSKQRWINECRAQQCKMKECSPDYCGAKPINYVFPIGKVSSNMMLHVRNKALESRVAFVIPPDTAFEILDYDLYTLKSKPYRLSNADAETCDPSLKPGTVVYFLYHLGEGNRLVWHNGKTGSCWLATSLNLYQTQQWYHVRYQGREGWWGDPVYCTRVARDEKCPIFNGEK